MARRAPRKTAKPKVDQPLPEIEDFASQVPTHYSNHIEVRVGYWDFRLRFMELVEATAERIVKRDLVTVFISPQQAAVLAPILVSHVKKYEEVFGEIPKPKNKS